MICETHVSSGSTVVTYVSYSTIGEPLAPVDPRQYMNVGNHLPRGNKPVSTPVLDSDAVSAVALRTLLSFSCL